MPFKLNHDRRRHIPRQKRKVINSAAYDAALRQRGSLTVWFTGEAIAGWRAAPRTTPGGQPWYSSLAILTALTFKAVFRLALRQTEGLIGSIIGLLGLALAVPDHSTLSRDRADAAGPTSPAYRRARPHGLAKASGYTARARAEAAIGRFKQGIGDALRSRTDDRRATEVDVAVHTLNRMSELGRPNYVRTA